MRSRFGKIFLAPKVLWGWVDSELDYLRTRSQFSAIRQYALDECGPRKHVNGKRRLVLGVVGGHPLLRYLQMGYDAAAPYYNPLLMFDEVHYFQKKGTRTRVLDWGYPMYIHGRSSTWKIVQVCRKYHVDILRAYDPAWGRVATEAGKRLQIPVIVSVH